ncbi:hypothetical protein Sjap_004642 [Stephania japonica]|uniref:Uncharacterized protein n=1 Tax=Stephania japonica TaxID=461633 RepID=A0AAP0K3V5_9MAGN
MGTIFNLVGLNGYAPSERELLRQRASGAVMSVAFLYEAGYGSSDYNATKGIIGISQPRHIAVLAMAKRVAYELDLHLGKEVGFQIKHDRRVRSSCSIKFMTDKILLRETQVETTLEKRRRAMQLSKVGLMVPHDDQPSKKRGREDDSDQTKELSSKNYMADVPKDDVNPLRPCNYKETQSTTSMRQKRDLIDPKVDCENLAVSCTPRPQTRPFIVHVFRPNDVEEKMKGYSKTTQVPQFLYEAGYGSSDFNATKGIIALDDLLVVGYNSNGGGAYDVNTVLRLISHCLDSDDLLYQVGKDVAESLQHALINRGLNL